MDIPEEDNAQVAKRKAIQVIMRDTTLNPQEKQKKIQEYMATGIPATAAAPADPPPQSQPEPAAASTEKEYKMDIPEEDNAQVAKRKAIQVIMRDTTLNPQEKQKKIQEYMATGAPATAAADPSPPSQSAPPPSQPQPPSSVAPSTSKQARMQEVMRDPSLTPAQKQQRIKQIMADDTASQPTPAPPQEVAPPPTDAVAPVSSSRQAMMDVMRDPNLTPQEKQQRIQQISSDDGGAAPEPEPTPEPPAPSDSKLAMQSIMNDASLTPQEKQQRIQQIMASGFPPAAAAAAPAPSSQSSAPPPSQSSTVGQDAIAKSRARRTSRATQPGATGSEPPRGPPPNAAVASRAEQDTMAENRGREPPPPAALANMETDVIAGAGVANAASSAPGAVSSTSADPANRKAAARGATRPGASSAASTESDPATRKVARSTTRSAADTSVASSQGQGGYGAPGAASSSGVDPASKKTARAAAATPGASSNTGVDPASRKTERATARQTAGASVSASVASTDGGRDDDRATAAVASTLSTVRDEEQTDMPLPDSNPPRQDYSGGGYVQQNSQPSQSTYDEPAMEIVDHSAGPEAFSPEAPTGDYAGLNYDPATVVGAEEGGFQAFVADTAVEALGVAAVMSEKEEEDTHRQKLRRRMMYICICLFIVLIAIIVPTVISVTSKGDDVIVELSPTLSPSAAPSPSPSSVPTSSNFDALLGAIKTVYDNDDAFNEAFGDFGSPQYKAALWAAAEGSLGLAPDHPRTLNRYYLATFYFATNGDNWFRCARESTDCGDGEEWLTPSDECQWLAVDCADPAAEDRRILKIFFPPSTTSTIGGNNVGGTLPGDVGFLTDLTTIILSKQKLAGSIPDNFDRLSNLETVLVLDNQLTGTFPEVLIGPNLIYLDIRNNLFGGQLPSSLSSTTLTDLRFASCQFTGTIPEISRLSNLVTFRAEGNDLTGTIPTGLYSLTNLRVLGLFETGLNGTLSEEIGQLKLSKLRLQNTNIGGPLPEALFTLTNLTELNLANASFSGPLSESFGLLDDATDILLNDNFFTGTIPMGFEELPRLNALTLHENYLSGSISDALCETKGGFFDDLKLLTADCLGDLPRVICATACCDECYAGREYEEMTSLAPSATPALTLATP